MTTATATKTARNNGPAKTAGSAENDLSREVEGLRRDLAALTERFSNITDAGIRTAGEKGSEARQRGEAAYAELSSRASEFERQAADSIRRHPLQALGIAAGVGFLAALLTRR